MYPAATEEELRLYWSRPFEWTENGKTQARAMMQNIIDEVQAGTWADGNPQKKTPLDKTLSGASNMSTRSSAARRAPNKTLQETEEASDRGVTGSDIEGPGFEHETPASAADEAFHGLDGQEHSSQEEREDIGTSSKCRQHQRTSQKKEPSSSPAREPVSQPASPAREPVSQPALPTRGPVSQPASHGRQHSTPSQQNRARNDDKFYILLFGVLGDLEDTDRANIQQYIERVCALLDWDSMQRIPNDALFHLLVGVSLLGDAHRATRSSRDALEPTHGE